MPEAISGQLDPANPTLSPLPPAFKVPLIGCPCLKSSALAEISSLSLPGVACWIDLVDLKAFTKTLPMPLAVSLAIVLNLLA